MQVLLNNMSATRAAAIVTRKDLIKIDRNDPFAIKEELENTTQRLSLIDDAIAQFRSILKGFEEAASEASDPGDEEDSEGDSGEEEEDDDDISSVESSEEEDSDEEDSDEEDDEYDISSVESSEDEEEERLADATAEERLASALATTATAVESDEE
jgi:hypothetical protein